jgi:transcriptional regulator with XRE-family HTH domain
MELIGRRVRTLRRAKDWTQEELAEAIGTHPKYISQIESGHRKPGLSLVVKLAQQFNTTTDALLTGEETRIAG